MSALKKDKQDGKPDLSLLYSRTLEECAYALMAGEIKYGRWNYCEGHEASRLAAAAMRHLLAYLWDGDIDADSTKRLGRPVTHLGCAMANISMLLHQQDLGTLKDDRRLTRD